MPTLLIAAIGLAVAGAGYVQQQDNAKKMQQAQQDEIQQQQAVEAQKQQQMDLEYQRQQKQILRNSIRARAVSLATATNQGANFGSALQGAYGGESGQFNTQALSSSQNYQIGQNIFGLNSNISQDRIAYSQAQAGYQAGGALMSLGGMAVSSAGTLGRIGQTSYAQLTRGMSFGTGPGSYMGGRTS